MGVRRAMIGCLRVMVVLGGKRAEPRGNMPNQQVALPPRPGDLQFERIDKPGMSRSLRGAVAMAQLAETVAQRLQFPPFERKHRNLSQNRQLYAHLLHRA
jgi:hypothetical protein